jgi:hypothetical protein
VLYDGGLSQGTSSYAAISFTEQGDLRLSAQDVGDGPRESWGDSDYEWWVTVRATETPRLLALFCATRSRCWRSSGTTCSG